MIRIEILARNPLILENLLAYVKGTLTEDGKLNSKTVEKISFLLRRLKIYLVSADTRKMPQR